MARGADIGRFGLSQYPAEAEILMPPCTALQAVESVIEKDLVIVVFRPTLPPPSGCVRGGRCGPLHARGGGAACEQAGGGGGGAGGGGGQGGGGGRRAQAASDDAARQWKLSMAESRSKALELEAARLRQEQAESRKAEAAAKLNTPPPRLSNAERGTRARAPRMPRKGTACRSSRSS